mmetsp:Transcript_21517/g.9972  ORF Transcript_21517/g.9972 Transcript_21517/m.9972 type:complete len:181 (+) Transcript_21517:4125-4667(+)
MFKIIKAFVLITFCFYMFCDSSFAADVAKIGIVDFHKIIDTSSAGRKAKAEIKEQFKKVDKNLSEKGTEINELRKKFEKEALVMDRVTRGNIERKLQIAHYDFNTMKKKYKDEGKILENKLVNKIQMDVMEIIKDIGKKEGFLLILEKAEGGVLYSPNDIDITDRLIKRYNNEFAERRKK